MPPQAYYCTRPGCPQPENHLEENDPTCQACGMPLILSGPRGRYQPIKPLGKGGFGETFQAVNLGRLNQDYCVIKRLYINPKNLGADKTPEQKAALKQAIEKAFEREARVLEYLGDKTGQIPSLYDYFPLTAPPFGKDTDFEYQYEYKYIVQQYIEGEDLSQELERRGRFSESEIIDVLQQILPVLKLIHSVDYDGKLSIHRDIKPSNIIREQRTKNLVLIDFGAVKQIIPGESDPQKSVVFGTSLYAPPEQGRIAYPSTDLYALAASCIRLLTKDDLGNIRNYANQWQWRNKYPGIVKRDELADILDKMLHPQPEARYQSAAEVIEVVEKLPPDNHKTNQDGEVIKALEKVTTENQETNSGNDDQTKITNTGKQQPLKLLIGGAAVMMAVFIYIYNIIPPRTKLSMLKDPATGIELNYPQSWSVEPKKNVFTPETKFHLTPPNPSSSPYSPSVFISQKDLPSGETLTGYTNSYLQELKDKGHTIDTSKEITINQLPGYQVVHTNKQDPNTPVRFLETWMIYQGKLYILTYSAEEQFYSQFVSTVEKDILPSWKIKPAKSP